MSLFLIYLLSCILITLIFINSKKISYKIKLFKKGIDEKPLTGGLGIYLFFFTNIFFLYFFSHNIINVQIFLLLFLTIIFLIGIMDDIFNLSYSFRLISIFFLLVFFFNLDGALIVNEFYFETFKRTYVVNNFAYFLTPLFILLLLNSMNMADGINGLSGMIFLSYVLILFSNNNELNYLIYCLIFSLLIFLIFNIKNKIYMGDSGIYFLSTIISFYTISEYNYGVSELSCEKIFLIFMVPGIDMFRLFIERLVKNKNPFKGDLNHLHHLLIKNFGLKKSIFAYISMIIWPNFIYLIFNFNIIILIVLNIIFYCSILIYLKKLKKLSN